MMKYYSFLGIGLELLGIALAIYFGLNHDNNNVSIIIAIGVIIFGGLIMVLPRFLLKPKLEIVKPEDNKRINELDERVADNGDTLLFTSITVRGKNIVRKKYLHVFTAISGGSECWVNGNAQPTDLLNKKDLEIHNITFGKKNDGNRNYMVFLLIMDEQIKSGETYKLGKLPDYIVKSDPIIVDVIK